MKQCFQSREKDLTAELLVKGMFAGSRTDQQFDKLIDGLDFRAGCKTAVFHILAEQGFKIQGNLQNFVSILVSAIRFQILRL